MYTNQTNVWSARRRFNANIKITHRFGSVWLPAHRVVRIYVGAKNVQLRRGAATYDAVGCRHQF